MREENETGCACGVVLEPRHHEAEEVRDVIVASVLSDDDVAEHH